MTARAGQTTTWPATRRNISTLQTQRTRLEEWRRLIQSPWHAGAREHLAVVAIPVALEHLAGVVLALERQERAHLGIAALHLVLARPAVIGQVVAAAVRDAEIDERAERVGRASDSAGVWSTCRLKMTHA